MEYLDFLKQYKDFYLLMLDTSSKWILCSYFEVHYQEDNKRFTINPLYLKEEEGIKSSFQKLSLYIKEILELYDKPHLILCGLGPGSFTGVRITVSTARTLSQLLKIPVIGIDSLSLYSYFLYKEMNLLNFYTGIDAKQKKYYLKKFNKEEFLNNEIYDFSKEEILEILENDLIYLDNPEPFLSWLNPKEKEKYNNRIKTISNINTIKIVEIIFEENFIKKSNRFYYNSYQNLLPIYIRKDPATEKYPQGFVRL